MMITFRIPLSIIPKQYKQINDSSKKMHWEKQTYSHIKEWIDHAWYKAIKKPERKTFENKNYLHSDIFQTICRKNNNSGQIAELYVKETCERYSLLYKKSPRFIMNFATQQKEKLNKIIPDGLITYKGDKQLLIEVKSLTECTGTAPEKLYCTLFKYTSVLEKLRAKSIDVELLVILCARQQDEKNGIKLVNAFNDEYDSCFMKDVVTSARKNGVMGIINVRDLDTFIVENIR